MTLSKNIGFAQQLPFPDICRLIKHLLHLEPCDKEKLGKLDAAELVQHQRAVLHRVIKWNVWLVWCRLQQRAAWYARHGQGAVSCECGRWQGCALRQVEPHHMDREERGRERRQGRHRLASWPLPPSVSRSTSSARSKWLFRRLIQLKLAGSGAKTCTNSN